MKERVTYEEAKVQVRKLGEFYRHLIVYFVINLGLISVNIITGQWWFVYPLLGWGIGIIAHGLSVCTQNWGKTWSERKIREYMEKG